MTCYEIWSGGEPQFRAPSIGEALEVIEHFRLPEPEVVEVTVTKRLVDLSIAEGMEALNG